MRRSFSIASPPSDAEVRLGMRMPEPGSSLKHALRGLEPGSRVATTLVAGDFLLPRDASIPLVMLAGGIGVTPFASQLAELTARGEQRDIVLLVVPSNPGEVLYRDVFAAAGARLVEVSRDDLTRDALLTLVPDLASRRGFVSGAPAVVSAGRAALRAAGAKRVRTDYFVGY
jgi:ferredoxin-NADP reductase